MMFTLIPEWFIRYKFFNSLFLGLSVGAIFTLYAPLEPSVYSLGGVVLAMGMLVVARLYHHILNARWFFYISLGVETLLLLAMLFQMVNKEIVMNKLIIAVVSMLLLVASVSTYRYEATHIDSSDDISSNKVSELSK